MRLRCWTTICCRCPTRRRRGWSSARRPRPSDRPAPDMAPGLDLFLGDLPSAAASPLAPLDFDGGLGDEAGFAGFGEPEAPLPPPPAASLMPDPGLPGADAGPGPGGAMDIGSMFESMMPVAHPPPVRPPPAALDDQLFAPTGRIVDAPAGRPGRRARRSWAAAARPAPRPSLPAAAPVLSNHFLPPTEEGAPGSNDCGFLLMLNGGGRGARRRRAGQAGGHHPGPGRGRERGAAGGRGPAGGAPAQGRAERRGHGSPEPPQGGAAGRGRRAGAGGGGVRRCWCCRTWARARRSPRRWGRWPADITRDHFPAYKQAVETLKGAAGEAKAPALRGAAAELQLLALLARGADKAAERAAVSRAGTGAGGGPDRRRRPARGGPGPGAAGPGPRPRRRRRDRAGRAGEHARRGR